MGYCQSCGAALKPGAKFCSGCGAQMDARPPATRARGGASLSRPYAASLLAAGVLGTLALVASAWLYLRSLPEYGPSADLNDDGFITLGEVEQELSDFPRGKSGRWSANIEVIESSMDEDAQQDFVENFSRIFTESACKDSFRHFYLFDIENFLYGIEKRKFIVEEMSANDQKVKFKITRTSRGTYKIIGRAAVSGEFYPENADFFLTLGAYDPDKAGPFLPFLRAHVVARRIGECAPGGGD